MWVFGIFCYTYLYQPQKCDSPWKVHRIRDITKRNIETDDKPHHLEMMQVKFISRNSWLVRIRHIGLGVGVGVEIKGF